LSEGTGEFPVNVREAYWEDEKPEATQPIPAAKIGDFVEFLRTIGY
jgi:hypothetical protein